MSNVDVLVLFSFDREPSSQEVLFQFCLVVPIHITKIEINWLFSSKHWSSFASEAIKLCRSKRIAPFLLRTIPTKAKLLSIIFSFSRKPPAPRNLHFRRVGVRGRGLMPHLTRLVNFTHPSFPTPLFLLYLYFLSLNLSFHLPAILEFFLWPFQ